VDTDRRSVIRPEITGPLSHHARMAAITVAALAIIIGITLASLWLASFFLYASVRLNPLHAGLWGWRDGLLMWRSGRMPEGGRRIAGAALLGALIAVGCPAMGAYSLWECNGRRRLYGSARFASEAEIREAGLL
jgi:hypothetical protein